MLAHQHENKSLMRLHLAWVKRFLVCNDEVEQYSSKTEMQRKMALMEKGQAKVSREQMLVFGVASQKIVHHVQAVLDNNAAICSTLIPADMHIANSCPGCTCLPA